MTDIRFDSEMHVELIDHMGTDLDIVHNARVSTSSDPDTRDMYEDCDYCGTVFPKGPLNKDKGLINFLMKNRHGSPFERPVLTFRATAPIFVWREHMRHRMASYNEESGRYKKLEPHFYVPDAARPLVQQGKAGEYEYVAGTANQHSIAAGSMRHVSEQAFTRYEWLLEEGIAREVARMVLPLNLYSTAIVQMNARALMNFLSLRTKDDGSAYPSYPMREIEMVAEKYEEHFAKLLPVTHAAFVQAGRVAP